MNLAKYPIFLLICSLLSAGCTHERPEEAGQPPNIVLIMADDMGVDDMGHRNPTLQTPHLDRLAAESAQFGQFYVNAVCAPSRASLLTGRHFLRTGVSHVHGGKDYIHLSETLLPERLQALGYATGMWGKWHSGYGTGYHPWERGFDEAYMADLYKHQNTSGVFNGQPVAHEGWADSVLADYAIRFAAQHAGRPFFAFLPLLTPHGPVRAPEAEIARYRERGLAEGPATLYAMITHMDRQLGRLMGALDSLGLAQNTIVVFLSDNGPQILTGFLTPEQRAERYVSGLRGHKGDLWENGVRSPLFVRWPGHIQPGLHHTFADVTDLFPTLLELAGSDDAGRTDAGRSAPKAQLPLDGRSLAASLLGKGEIPEKVMFDFAHKGWAPADSILYTPDGLEGEYDPVDKGQVQWQRQTLYVRRGTYKLIQNPGPYPMDGPARPAYHLYDLSADPAEQHNLAESRPELMAELLSVLEAKASAISGEAHAFSPPVFQIGTDSVSRVWGRGAASFSGPVRSSAMEPKHWRAGAQATYQLHIHKPGTYAVRAAFRLGKQARQPRLLLRVAGQQAELLLNGGQEAAEGELILPAGLHLLTLNIDQPSASPSDTLLSALRHIEFVRQR